MSEDGVRKFVPERDVKPSHDPGCTPLPHAAWPSALQNRARLRATATGRAREKSDADLWLAIAFGLTRYARMHAGRMGVADRAAVRDAVADKTMDLIDRIDRGAWDPVASTPEQVRGFLSAVARNGVADVARAGMHLVVAPDPASKHSAEVSAWAPAPVAESAADVAAGEEYAGALVGCASGLSARARAVWFLRVVLELSSSEISRHPTVRTTPAAVDTMLRRCRHHMRGCMELRGFDRHAIPAGTFTALWRRLAAGTSGLDTPGGR